MDFKKFGIIAKLIGTKLLPVSGSKSNEDMSARKSDAFIESAFNSRHESYVD